MSKASVVSKIRPIKTAHTSNSQKGMGDYYGTGFKNPTGTSRDVLGQAPLSKKKVGKAPKSLA